MIKNTDKWFIKECIELIKDRLEDYYWEQEYIDEWENLHHTLSLFEDSLNKTPTNGGLDDKFNNPLDQLNSFLSIRDEESEEVDRNNSQGI